jgi:hypothetical protein
MKKKLTLIVGLLLIGIGFVSCVEKFPRTVSENEGVLIIPHKAVNKSMNKNGYGYRYHFNYSPQTPAEIIINPCSKKFFAITNFPAGKYQLDSMTVYGNTNPLSVSVTIMRDVPISENYSFEIKPGHITVFEKSFNVYKEDTGYKKTTQYRCFEDISEDQRKEIREALSKIENIGDWKFSSSAFDPGT